MQRGKHQTEFPDDEVNESYDADEQQPRGTPRLHNAKRLGVGNFQANTSVGQHAVILANFLE